MYLGKILEMAEKDELYENPLNPYTKALLQAVPVLDPDCRKTDLALEGEIPSPANRPQDADFIPGAIWLLTDARKRNRN